MWEEVRQMDAVIFGTQLSQLRKKNGVTQRELAQKLHVHIMTIKSWAGGSCYPDAKNLCMLADSFHIATDYPLGSDEAEVLSLTHIPSILRSMIRQIVQILIDQYMSISWTTA